MKCAVCDKERSNYSYQAINGSVLCKDCVLDVIANKNNYKVGA